MTPDEYLLTLSDRGETMNDNEQLNQLCAVVAEQADRRPMRCWAATPALSRTTIVALP